MSTLCAAGAAGELHFRAEGSAGARAKLLIVTMRTSAVTMGLGAELSGKEPSIPALGISKAAGRQVLLAMQKDKKLTASCWKRKGSVFGDLLSEAFTGVLAVALVAVGAWYGVEDLRRPGTAEEDAQRQSETVSVEESAGLHFVLFGSLLLTVLYFFMKYLIYLLLFLFASGAVSTTCVLLEPAFASCFPALRAKKACTLPDVVVNVLGVEKEQTWTEVLSELVGLVLAVCFLIFRNDDDIGWALQDIIAIMFLLTLQRTVRLPNLKVGTLLLICTFFFDIFWVFISPVIFKKSVMIEVATGGGTGQSVPMVLKIPALDGELPGQFKILGLGDIAIPGLLISLLLRHDLVKRHRRCAGYFLAGVIGYAVGLLATFVSLYLMQHGQPALLFLVPGTLVPTCIIALRKGELKDLWAANYGPEPLEGDVEKQS
ncbi:Sppl2b [Symbiodinium pilosum]|uniref:Sppl2b protein n=1 Tax=Symbiodinium pilosum TaxID=2952 RepID=A0A812WVL5_SYMPI|nr:Sppl2b [Symbiodinium pilosum]